MTVSTGNSEGKTIVIPTWIWAIIASFVALLLVVIAFFVSNEIGINHYNLEQVHVNKNEIDINRTNIMNISKASDATLKQLQDLTEEIHSWNKRRR